MNDALLKPGHKCYAKRDIVRPADEHSPAGLEAAYGQHLTVVEQFDPPKYGYRYAVEDSSGHRFYVTFDEVTVVRPPRKTLTEY